jgi:sulfite reductase alpha subunit-like flavoprotein
MARRWRQPTEEVQRVRALVCYESMYGNTHQVAEAIAEGLRASFDVSVAPVGAVGAEDLGGVDLLVVGAPTHAHGLPRASSREEATTRAAAADDPRSIEPTAEGPGAREWLDRSGALTTRSAAFDTRVDLSPILTGRASKAIAKRLRRLGAEEASPPESFLVRKDDTLVPGELDRARAWGSQLARCVGPSADRAGDPG